MTLEQIRLKAQENRVTVFDQVSFTPNNISDASFNVHKKNPSRRRAGSVLGAGADAMPTDWDKVLSAVGSLSLLAHGIYTAQGATGVTV